MHRICGSTTNQPINQLTRLLLNFNYLLLLNCYYFCLKKIIQLTRETAFPQLVCGVGLLGLVVGVAAEPQEQGHNALQVAAQAEAHGAGDGADGLQERARGLVGARSAGRLRTSFDAFEQGLHQRVQQCVRGHHSQHAEAVGGALANHGFGVLQLRHTEGHDLAVAADVQVTEPPQQLGGVVDALPLYLLATGAGARDARDELGGQFVGHDCAHGVGHVGDQCLESDGIHVAEGVVAVQNQGTQFATHLSDLGLLHLLREDSQALDRNRLNVIGRVIFGAIQEEYML
jgi:hypothetical protein